MDVMTTQHDQHVGDALDLLRSMPDGMAQTCVTSPPYFGLRNYGMAGQIGQEDTPDAYVSRIVEVFREVRRVIRPDGTLWLNLGDSYSGNKGSQSQCTATGIKPKDLIGIPWMVAFALRMDGWFLRSDVIWAKGNPVPESVKDRPTRSHEHVFLLTASSSYFYDADAIREPHASDYSRDAIAKAGMIGGERPRGNNFSKEARMGGEGTPRTRASRAALLHPLGRNCRDIWNINPKPFKGAHFATMPVELAEKCIRAGSKVGSTVLDPFGGSGTTAVAAKLLGRNSSLIELNPTYAELAANRVAATSPLLGLGGEGAVDLFGR